MIDYTYRTVRVLQRGSRHEVPALNRHFPSETHACRAIDLALKPKPRRQEAQPRLVACR